MFLSSSWNDLKQDKGRSVLWHGSATIYFIEATIKSLGHNWSSTLYTTALALKCLSDVEKCYILQDAFYLQPVAMLRYQSLHSQQKEKRITQKINTTIYINSNIPSFIGDVLFCVLDFGHWINTFATLICPTCYKILCRAWMKMILQLFLQGTFQSWQHRWLQKARKRRNQNIVMHISLHWLYWHKLKRTACLNEIILKLTISWWRQDLPAWNQRDYYEGLAGLVANKRNALQLSL